jgi:hypothetical protein
MDVSWMEALACGIPLVTPLFNELTFDFSEFGILIENETEILTKVRLMIQTYSSLIIPTKQRHHSGASCAT